MHISAFSSANIAQQLGGKCFRPCAQRKRPANGEDCGLGTNTAHKPSIVKKHQNITQSLRQLDALEKELSHLPADKSQSTGLTRQIGSLRALIPTAILTHHDRMKARGKQSVAPVRNGVCGACHLAIPRGHVIRLRDPDELNVCDSCGAFIYLAEEELVLIETAFLAGGKKPAVKKKKTAA